MGLLLAIVLLFSGTVVLMAMILVFPVVLPPFVEFQNTAPGVENFGGHGEYILFIAIYIVPLLFMGSLVIVTIIAGSMRQEAHRERF